MATARPPRPLADVTLEAYLRAVPSDEETAHRAIAPYVEMTPTERWVAFADLQREVEALLGDTDSRRADPPFWQHWKDPGLGSSR